MATASGERWVEREVEVRWRDTDGLGHVNHAVFLTYLEEGRSRWLETHGIGPEAYVVARVSLDFRHEITLDEPWVLVRSRAVEAGRTSVITREEILDRSGRRLGEATVVLVLWDEAARGPRPLTEAERASIQAELDAPPGRSAEPGRGSPEG